MEENPLVSICVIVYNSSKFVFYTLESIKKQTYKKIELIISDDCSTDNTVEVCENWIEGNRSYFQNVIILKSPVNTGVSGNANRARRIAKGSWIKGIAGDDLLLPHCIEYNILFIKKNKNAQVIFSNVKLLGGSKEQQLQISRNFNYSILNLSPEQQFRHLLKGNCLPAPTAFISKKIYDLYKYDERIPLMEDYPYWLTLTKNGIKLYGFDSETIEYRLHSNSISTSSRSKIFKKSVCLCSFYYVLPNLYFSNPILAIKILIRLFRTIFS